MGVQGMNSLLDNHSRVFREVKFRGMKLLIDGCNFLNHLYFSSGLEQNLGGEYAGFEDVIERFVSVLSMCNISPYFMMDGSKYISGVKNETSIKRMENRIKRSHLAAVDGRQEGILPPLALNVFRQTLARLKVPFAFCYAEADQELANLAAKWRCPVLSDDSDFTIFDLPAGTLPIRYFLWYNVNTSQKFIPCRIYNASSFCIYFGIPRLLLPALAALAGNDYSKLNMFDLNKGGFSHLKELICWLRNFQRPEDALLAALQRLQVNANQQREKIDLLSQSMDMYKLRASPMKEYFIKGQAAPPPEKGKAVIPEWTLLPLMQGQLTMSIIDILVLHMQQLTIMVDNCDLPSANSISRPLRKLFYGLLLGKNTAPPVEERDRYRHSIKITHIVNHPTQKLQLNSIHKAEASERLQVLLEGLGVTAEVLNKLPPQLRLPVAVTHYWMQWAEPCPDQKLLEALLLGMIMGYEARPEEIPKAGPEVRGQRKLTPDSGMVHSICQWQACFKDTLHLNQLLCFPLQEPHIARLFQGTFIQRLLQKENTFLPADPQLYNLMLSATQGTSRLSQPRSDSPFQQMLKIEDEYVEEECWALAELEVLMEEQLVMKIQNKKEEKRRNKGFCTQRGNT